MARIRSIKPEFQHSESMGRISRNARLCFVLMWTIADDEGRLRGNSRMLASLLFPYDDDAPNLMDGWLTELETERCLVRYEVEGYEYIEITNWLKHQKIDKPSKSKLPPFVESSRIVANPLERSSGDQGSRIEGSKDQGMDQGALETQTLANIREASPKVVRGTSDFHADYDWALEVLKPLYPKPATDREWQFTARQIAALLGQGETRERLLQLAQDFLAQKRAENAGSQFIESPQKHYHPTEGKWGGPFALPTPAGKKTSVAARATWHPDNEAGAA